jgi:hypothetical protein
MATPKRPAMKKAPAKKAPLKTKVKVFKPKKKAKKKTFPRITILKKK